MAQNKHWEQDKEATVYIGNLDERVTDGTVWELMLQAGRIVNVHLPKDRVTQTHQGFGFVEFISEEDAEYAARIMNQIRLYGKPIRVNKASADKQKTFEVGAELFIGNLDPLVDEKTLYETFSTFGNLVAAPKIARDENGISKGYGFVSYDCFESSDKAIESMNGQYLMNKEVSVQYAYKKDGKGERHGDQAERLLASQARKNNVQISAQPLPPQLFPPTAPNTPGVPQVPMGVPPGPMTPQSGRPPHMSMNPQQMPYQPVPPPQQQPPRLPTASPTPQSHYQQGLPIQPPPAGLPPRPPPPAGFSGGQPQFHPQGYPPPQGVAPQQPPYGFAPQQPIYGSVPPPLPTGFGMPGGRGQPPQMKPGYPPTGPPPAGFGAPAPGVGTAPGFAPQQPAYPGFGRGR